MENNVLEELENILTISYFEKFKQDFILTQVKIETEHNEIDSAFVASGSICSIDSEKGEIVFFDNLLGENKTLFFEDKLRNYIYSLIPQIKTRIDLAFIEYYGTQKTRGFIEYLKSSVLRIKNKSLEVTKAYPHYREFLNGLVEFLNDKHKCKIEIPFEDIYIPPFKLKNPKLAKSNKLTSLYYEFVKYEIIAENSISSDDFVKVISGAKTDKVIVFKAKNGIAVKALDSIKHIYSEYNAGIIERSKRFYTKQNYLLTQDIYNVSLSRIPKNSERNLADLINSIHKIFPLYVFDM